MKGIVIFVFIITQVYVVNGDLSIKAIKASGMFLNAWADVISVFSQVKLYAPTLVKQKYTLLDADVMFWLKEIFRVAEDPNGDLREAIAKATANLYDIRNGVKILKISITSADPSPALTVLLNQVNNFHAIVVAAEVILN